MESNQTFRLIVIVTLVTILTPRESKGAPLRDPYVARSLLHVFPPSESESPSPAPAPGPEVMTPVTTPTYSPAVASPEAPTDYISPPSEGNFKTLANNLLNPPLLSPEIKNICSNTDFPPICESSVIPLLTTQLKPDVSSVLVLAIQASVTATKTAMATVEKVAATDCQELYDDAVANLEDAVNAVKSRDIATVNSYLSAAMTDYSTCNDGFEEAEVPNPLADVSDKLTKMVSNCLAISTLIK